MCEPANDPVSSCVFSGIHYWTDWPSLLCVFVYNFHLPVALFVHNWLTYCPFKAQTLRLYLPSNHVFLLKGESDWLNLSFVSIQFINICLVLDRIHCFFPKLSLLTLSVLAWGRDDCWVWHLTLAQEQPVSLDRASLIFTKTPYEGSFVHPNSQVFISILGISGELHSVSVTYNSV